MAPNTIVFGPTGGVAGYAVQYAASKGSHVTLAMRDTSKPIQGLSAAQESSGKFARVQADLVDPASVKEAASKAQAYSAFIYFIRPNGAPKESIQALKDAGVKHIVFNSSFSVTDPVSEIPETEFIPYAHGKIETYMHEIFGEGNYTAVRPTYFASNPLMQLVGIKKGVVKEAFPNNKGDYISPQDIGEVAGYFLVQEGAIPPSMDVGGAQVMEHEKAFTDIGKAIGKEVKVEKISLEEYDQRMQQGSGLPKPIHDYLIKLQVEEAEGKTNYVEEERFKKAQGTVRELLGRDSITWEQWLEENKALFM